MRKAFLVLVPAICLVGCGELPTVEEAARATPPKVVQPPTIIHSTKLGLFPNLQKTDAGELFTGDGPAVVSNLFPVPSRAFLFQELPPGFGQPYSAYGFSSNDGTSFGVIYYDNRVALAMETIEQQTQQQIDGDGGIERVYESEIGKPIVELSGAKTHYWFWDDLDARQRLMICAVQSSKDKSKLDVTIAVGAEEPMDALNMDAKDAAKDRMALEGPPLPPRVYPS